MIESKIDRLFRVRVRQLGGVTEKLAPTHVGIPDRFVLFPGGRVEFVELKTVEGRLRDAQLVWIQRAAQLGVRVTVLYGAAQVELWAATRRRELGAYLDAQHDATVIANTAERRAEKAAARRQQRAAAKARNNTPKENEA